jgi:hypothetical protein
MRLIRLSPALPPLAYLKRAEDPSSPKNIFPSAFCVNSFDAWIEKSLKNQLILKIPVGQI